MRFRIPCIHLLEQRSAWVSSNVEWLTNSVYKITLFSITRLIFFLRQNNPVRPLTPGTMTCAVIHSLGVSGSAAKRGEFR